MIPAVRTTETTDEPFGPVLDFMRLIWALDHGLQSLSKRMLRELGITGPQRVALRVVGRRPGLSAGALATILRLHPSTITGIVKRLEDRGLMTRTWDPRDRRRARLRLTRKGRALDSPRLGTVEAVVEQAIDGAPRSRVRAAERLLAGVSDALLAEAAGRGRNGARSRRSRPDAP